jgi:uncharacterized protein with FMN-binding domain
VRRVLAILVVTLVAVVLLASYDTDPPATLNPNSALRARAMAPRAVVEPAPAFAPAEGSMSSTRRTRAKGRVRTATGPAAITPFSVIQVRATLTGRTLTGVETVALTGDGPYTNALNARAEPILREEALRAGSAKIDVVSGATSTSLSWMESLQAAIDAARG